MALLAAEFVQTLNLVVAMHHVFSSQTPSAAAFMGYMSMSSLFPTMLMVVNHISLACLLNGLGFYCKPQFTQTVVAFSAKALIQLHSRE